MSVDFDILNKTDKWSQYLVFGYFREYEQEKELLVPVYVTLAYLPNSRIKEYFSLFPSYCVKLSENKTRITVKEGNGNWSNTCYGDVVIDPLTDKGVYKWHIKICSQPVVSGMIGISSDHNTVCHEFSKTTMPVYHLNLHGGNVYGRTQIYASVSHTSMKEFANYKFGWRHLKANDVICLEFNTKEMYIKFYINGDDKGKVIKGKDIYTWPGQGIRYRLAISACSQTDSYEIIRFEHHK